MSIEARLTVSLSGGHVVEEVAVRVLIVHSHPLLEVVDEGGDEGVHLNGLTGEDLEDLGHPASVLDDAKLRKILGRTH